MRDVKPVLISRTVKPGRVHAIADADRPTAGPLAVAVRLGGGGWQVTAQGGAVVGDRLDRTAALRVMRQAAKAAAVTLTAPLIAAPSMPPTRPVEVTSCPF